MPYLLTRQPPVVHRDLKSLNALLDGGDEVKLCDFGMARTCERAFVATEHIAGSPSWMAPEVLRGDDFNTRSDVYSFGVILWELATLSVPWATKNMAQLVGLVGFSGATLPLPVEGDATGTPAAFTALMKECFLEAPERPAFADLRERLDRMIVEVD